MKARFATQSEINNWNDLILTNPNHGNIFQTKEFAFIKSINNWSSRFVVLENNYLLVLERKIPLLGNFWYVPKGPGITSVKDLEDMLPELKRFAHKHHVFTVKLEPELLETPAITKVLVKNNLQKSLPVQAANTIIIDLSRPIEEIVANFSSKTRGNIRAAVKAGVTTEVVPINNSNCKLFYKMMTQTINGRSHVRSYDYFKTFWETHYRAGTGIFLFAKSGKKVISMDFIMLLGEKAARKDAASTRNHSIRGASALLEMYAIEYLKDRGVKEYDLYGSPPANQIKNPQHPYYGFGTFKAGFNSKVTDYIGCYDMVINVSAYRIWRMYGERVVHKIYSLKYHDLFY